MAVQLSLEERAHIRTMAAEGSTYREIVAEVGRSMGAVGHIVRRQRPGWRVQLLEWEPGAGRLTLDRTEATAGSRTDCADPEVGQDCQDAVVKVAHAAR